MQLQTIAYACFEYRTLQDFHVLFPIRLYNCTLEDLGAGAGGDVSITIANTTGGKQADRLSCIINAIPSANGVLCAWSTIHTSDSVKRIQFRDETGALSFPDFAWVEILRCSPLPA